MKIRMFFKAWAYHHFYVSFIFVVTILFCSPTQELFKRQIVFWNVGQGSWTTFVDEKNCIHVDMGGTQRTQAHLFCQNKNNFLFLTHYDWDHLNLIPYFRKKVRQICLMQNYPKNLSRKKKKILEDLRLCENHLKLPIEQIYTSSFTHNNESHIYILAQKVLITGDASKKIERTLLGSSKLKTVQLLVLGHHGSQTSTDALFLHKLPGLKIAIASCLRKKYGHPHVKTTALLKKNHTPLLMTEMYGHIFFEIKP